MSGENDTSLLQWAIGLLWAAVLAIGAIVAKSISSLRGDTLKERDAIWARINELSDSIGLDRADAARTYATREDITAIQIHLDRRLDRHEDYMRLLIVNRPPVKEG